VTRYTRGNGSVTWQRHEKHATFYAFHDLSHFAVETALGFRKGFYGLIADGWDISDVDGKGARGKLPPEAVLVEHIVGLFDRERSGVAAALSAEEFNTLLGQLVGEANVVRTFTEEKLRDVRSRMKELHENWAALPPGGALYLKFDR